MDALTRVTIVHLMAANGDVWAVEEGVVVEDLIEGEGVRVADWLPVMVA